MKKLLLSLSMPLPKTLRSFLLAFFTLQNFPPQLHAYWIIPSLRDKYLQGTSSVGVHLAGDIEEEVGEVGIDIGKIEIANRPSSIIISSQIKLFLFIELIADLNCISQKIQRVQVVNFIPFDGPLSTAEFPPVLEFVVEGFVTVFADSSPDVGIVFVGNNGEACFEDGIEEIFLDLEAAEEVDIMIIDLGNSMIVVEFNFIVLGFEVEGAIFPEGEPEFDLSGAFEFAILPTDLVLQLHVALLCFLVQFYV